MSCSPSPLSSSSLVLLLPSSLLLLATDVGRGVSGHGLLTVPPSKNGGALNTPVVEDDTSHFALASYGIIDKAFFDGDHSVTPWQRPGHFTWEDARDVVPGHPQTLHPCGCDAGDVGYCAGVTTATGFGETTDGSVVANLPNWARGGEATVGWNAFANHAGGYVYTMCERARFRACRDDFLPENPLTATRQEKDDYLRCVWDCFEANTLDFVDDSQRLYYHDQPCDRVYTKAAEKTGRDGRVWRATPIPDKNQVTNGGEGVCTRDSVVAFGSDKVEQAFGTSFGNEDVCDDGPHQRATKDWHVVDRVAIPENSTEGEWLLSWRWDAYMADQLWTGCADVRIVGPGQGDDQPEEECGTFSPTASSSPTFSPETKPSCPEAHYGFLPWNRCTQYYRCVAGVVTGGLLSCAEGTLFDESVQNCDWEDRVTCPTPAPSATTSSSPSKTPTTSSGACKPWCPDNDQSWDEKCTWVNCSLCDECRPTSSVPSAAPSNNNDNDNDDDEISWFISEGTDPTITTTDDENKKHVIRVRYTMSDKVYGVKVLDKDCETDSDVPSLEFSDVPSSDPNLVDVDVDLTVDPSVAFYSEGQDSFEFCLSKFLLSSGGRIVVARNDVFRVRTNDLVEFDVGNVVVEPQTDDQHHDLDLEYGGTIDAYECDAEGNPVGEPAPVHGPFDVVRVCLETEEEEGEGGFFVKDVEDLTVRGLVSFDYVANGIVPDESEGLVTIVCDNGKCLASVKLLNEFFLSVDLRELRVTGNVRLSAGGSGRKNDDDDRDRAKKKTTTTTTDERQEAKGTWSVSVTLEEPCKEKGDGVPAKKMIKMLRSVL